MRKSVIPYPKPLKKGKYWYVKFWSDERQIYCNDKPTGVKVVGAKGGKLKAEKIGYEIYQRLKNELCEAHEKHFIDFLYDFWHPESDHCKEHIQTEGKPLTNGYLTNCRSRIKNHIAPFPQFQNIKITKLKKGMFKKWKLWMSDRGIGAHTINDTIGVMNTALEAEVDNENLNRNPIKGLKRALEITKEKGILTSDEQKMLPDVQERNPRVKLGCLLSVLGSLRLGEVRGLKWGDIDFTNEIITIKNSYVDTEGLGLTKTRSVRHIPLMPQYIPLLNEISDIHCGDVKPSDFVLYNQARKDRPMGKESIYKGYKRILNKIGITADDRKDRNITFHSFRHTFVSEAYKRGLSKFEVKALAGHLTDEMSAHYTHEAQAISTSMAEVKNKLI